MFETRKEGVTGSIVDFCKKKMQECRLSSKRNISEKKELFAPQSLTHALLKVVVIPT